MTEYGLPLLLIACLILVNGLFVAAEFAFAGAPRAAIEHRAAKGSRVARTLSSMLSDPRSQDRYIATAQLGITFASLGLGMYGEHTAAGWIYDALGSEGLPEWLASHAIATVLAVAILTYFHIVVGEMVPKTLALQSAERTALWITPIMIWIKRALYPLVVGLNGIGNFILGLLGVRREVGTDQTYTPDELAFVVRESVEGGLLEREAATVLTELLAFARLTAGEAMTPRVAIVGIPVGADAERIAMLLGNSPHTRYPVYEGDIDHVIGAAHIKDLFRILGERRVLAREDARPVPFVPETLPLDALVTVLRDRQAQMAVVLDEYGGTEGLVTIEDLFEEIVGEIPEGSSRPPGIGAAADGSLSVAGTVRIEELGEWLGIELTHPEVETVGGLILTLLERPPNVGDTVTYEDLRLEVTKVAGHGVERCRVVPAPNLPVEG